LEIFAVDERPSLVGHLSCDEKSLITLTPAVNVIKRFFIVADDEAK
jgi:hypothetical protein